MNFLVQFEMVVVLFSLCVYSGEVLSQTLVSQLF